MNGLKNANEYILKFKDGVNGKYKLKYHMSPPVGWMNDPNGLICFGGKYHLFYQYYPYDSINGVMHWGHYVSEDLISYEDAGVALAPEENGENIFSGGAVEANGCLNALYTRHFEHYGVKTEEVYLATSRDGYEFENRGCVFDNETLPEDICRTDFRDPCPVKIGNEYYVFVGGKNTRLNQGVIIVLGGRLDKLEYKFTIGPFYELGDMGECPSYCRVGGKDVLAASGCHVKERGNDFKNINSSVFIVGDIDFKKGAMRVDFIREIDKGDTFYAPQFINGINRPVMIGWLEMWNKRYPTHEWGHGWVGAFSLPRVISYLDGDIYQTPVEEIENYRRPFKDGGLPVSADVLIEFGGKGSVTVRADNGKFVIGCDNGVYLDTTETNNMNGCVRRTNGGYGACSVRVILDVSGIEVFVEGGKEVISSRIYLDGKYSVETDGAASVKSIYKLGKKL